MAVPMTQDLQPNFGRLLRLAHATDYRGGERKLGCWYRRQSTAVSLITHVANLVP